MYLSIHAESGSFYVWAEVEPELFMQIASFSMKEDAELFVEARQQTMEKALQGYLRVQ